VRLFNPVLASVPVVISLGFSALVLSLVVFLLLLQAAIKTAAAIRNEHKSLIILTTDDLTVENYKRLVFLRFFSFFQFI